MSSDKLRRKTFLFSRNIDILEFGWLSNDVELSQFAV